MKTKELIKQLQKEDPTGEAYVRCGDGAVTHFELKSGYWDGPYEYIDENGNFVISNQGSKVDIVTMDSESWIWDHDGDYSKIKFDLGPLEYSEGKIKAYKEEFEKISKEYKRFEQSALEEFTFHVMHKYKEGFVATQQADVKIGMYNCMYFYKYGSKKIKLRQGDCGAILKSGFFKPVTRGKLIYWELIIGGTK